MRWSLLSDNQSREMRGRLRFSYRRCTSIDNVLYTIIVVVFIDHPVLSCQIFLRFAGVFSRVSCLSILIYYFPGEIRTRIYHSWPASKSQFGCCVCCQYCLLLPLSLREMIIEKEQSESLAWFSGQGRRNLIQTPWEADKNGPWPFYVPRYACMGNTTRWIGPKKIWILVRGISWLSDGEYWSWLLAQFPATNMPISECNDACTEVIYHAISISVEEPANATRVYSVSYVHTTGPLYLPNYKALTINGIYGKIRML